LSIASDPICWPRSTMISVFNEPAFRKSVTYIYPL
jgi:hypothetical protein